MKTIIAITLLLAASTVGAADTSCVKPKPIYKVTKLSLTEVSIACTNGADPTGKKLGDILVISCGKE